jgi:hypothetical protein
MLSPKSYFARMNENRPEDNWLSDDELLQGTERFLKLNNYTNIEYNRVFLYEGERTFPSPIVATRTMKYKEDGEEVQVEDTIVSIFRSNLRKYDLRFLGFMEAFAFNILDNHDLTNPMLVTDSLSYFHIIRNQEINVAIEDLMREGLFILFLNHKFAYAFFDTFENMTKPIPIQG